MNKKKQADAIRNLYPSSWNGLGKLFWHQVVLQHLSITGLMVGGLVTLIVIIAFGYHYIRFVKILCNYT